MEKEEVKKEAEKVLEELSHALGEVDLDETYYVVEDINVTREDSNPEVDDAFLKSIRKNAVQMDKDGYFIMEKGKWVG